MKASKDFIIREIAGEFILIPVGKAALRIHGMINLTESAYVLWKALQKDCTIDSLVKVLLAEYDVTPDVAESDVKEFIDQMNQLGLIE